VNAFAAATAVAVLVVTGAGCSIHADKTQTRSTPTSATTPTSRSAEPAGPATAYSVHCIHVPANISRRIASRVGEGAGMAPGLAEAVRSPDLENVYVVAMQFKVTGVTQTQLGFWAVRPSVQVDQHRRVMSVGRSAQHFTRWPHVRYSSADVRREIEAAVGDSAACLLK